MYRPILTTGTSWGKGIETEGHVPLLRCGDHAFCGQSCLLPMKISDSAIRRPTMSPVLVGIYREPHLV